MKKILIISIIIALFGSSALKAQVTLNFESGNIGIEQGNCWGFKNVTFSNLEFRISGFWSGRSNQLTTSLITDRYIKSPWLTPGSGNLTLKTRLENDGGSSATMRAIVFSYISYDPASPSSSKEGSTTSYYTYNFPTPFNIWVQDLSVPIPQAIANSQYPYKILISFIGTGGSTRAFSDDIVIPGTYFSDPANNCTPLQFIIDADGDGVADEDDEYDSDPNRAYNSYYPSLNQSGTLAFEDLWPAKGDFDFNDVVVNYRLQTVTNADNNVVEVFARFVLRASGASRHNGFGFQLDGISPDKIISVSGNYINPAPGENHHTYNMAANGLESGQAFATCIVFGCYFDVMGPGAFNTSHLEPFIPYDTMNVHLVFINNGSPAPGGTVSNTQLTSGVFNFFIVGTSLTGEIIGNVQPTYQNREKEIHLANRIPTSLANSSYFGTKDDDSQPANGKYYKTENNLPWGINILEGFDYPIEKAPINEAYLHFTDWAASGGTSFQNWFSDIPGNRNPALIY
jgi:LruC domain-containing protein